MRSLMTPRAAMIVANAEGLGRLEAMVNGAGCGTVDAADLCV